MMGKKGKGREGKVISEEEMGEEWSGSEGK